MKLLISLVFLLSFQISMIAQSQTDKTRDSIIAEATELYKSEMASWYGTDLFLARFKDQSKIAGYFSYSDQDLSRCIFFSKGNTPVVIGTVVFDKSYDLAKAVTELTERNFTPHEFNIYTIRAQALKS